MNYYNNNSTDFLKKKNNLKIFRKRNDWFPEVLQNATLKYEIELLKYTNILYISNHEIPDICWYCHKFLNDIFKQKI